MGQLKCIAKTMYKFHLNIEVMDQEVKFDTIHVSFQVSQSSGSNHQKKANFT